MSDTLFIALQHILPQHLLSRGTGWLAATRIKAIKNTFISRFAKAYDVNMAEAAEENPLAYENFNAFFTRALKPGMRPIAKGAKVVACPADGAISQIGGISQDRIFQAKGRDYSVEALLGGDAGRARPFIGGKFATVYLSPKDYHRVHMPFTGRLREMIYVPGDLYSVNSATAGNVDNLFARNERLVCLFDTAAGPMAVVLVGAMIVAGIATVWTGDIKPHGRHVTVSGYQHENITLEKGDELGRFYLGSTAIVLFGPNVVEWADGLEAGTPVRMGEAFGVLR
jgi:phosphatidylserine decarboxylase